jgi:hypothetical protein
MTMTNQGEFQEIAHSGGQVTFTISTSPAGLRQYQVGWTHSRPTPTALFAVWALPQGAAVAGINMGGIGTPWNLPPVSGCFPVMIASDSQGCFGHLCPACGLYWRSSGTSLICPYCAVSGDRHIFLTEAQQCYVSQYCALLREALNEKNDGNYVIDMDAVADAVGKDTEKPPFYYTEESQQKNFNCSACGAFNDIIGKFCYCSRCGTRNDLDEFETITMPGLRANINSGGNYGVCVSSIVSVFDSFVAQYVQQMVHRIPIRSARKARLERMRFHDLRATANEIKTGFDIDILGGIRSTDLSAMIRLFHRRHLYEHNSGVVDAKYLADTGDDSVRLGQAIHETQSSAHQLLNLVARMAENLHSGFHDIFPPEAEPIRRHTELAERNRSTSRGHKQSSEKKPNTARPSLRGI